MEFSFVKERKAETLLDNASANVLEFVKVLSPVERAAALAWANAALLAGVVEYGRPFAYAPMKMQPEFAIKAVMDFAAYRKQVEDVSESLKDRPAHDPAISAYKWELLATLVVIVTAGASLHAGARNAARSIWQVLGAAMPMHRQATQMMLLYAKTYDVEPVPPVPNKKSDKAYIMALASNLPPMFRAKAKS